MLERSRKIVSVTGYNMATRKLELFDHFDNNNEDFEAYRERLEAFLMVNEIIDKKAVAL